MSQVLVFHFATSFSGCLDTRLVRYSTGLKIGFWLRFSSTELTLVRSLQIKPKKYSAGKYAWHRFWKGTRLCWESKQNECLCRSRPKGSLKKISWEISQNSQKNIFAAISFWIKLKLCRSPLKTSLFSSGVFLWNLQNL